ncbi:hypothetical protein [Synechococcus sp. PCC 7502]|uniref:hypothetical protein n=1 Tax=Synechococcus sp. PCC 7502 TaxID=1173263 RepID=UPI0006848F1A|nr:hypothetical protein [Synechococcus sp. PCC 7502]
MSDAKEMTTANIAGISFGGNIEKARELLDTPNLIPKMLSRSRFNRRLHKLELIVFLETLVKYWSCLNAESIYSIDSFPIPVCDNIQISRSRMYKDESYRGFQANISTESK